jgi:hypothetical protein
MEKLKDEIIKRENDFQFTPKGNIYFCVMYYLNALWLFCFPSKVVSLFIKKMNSPRSKLRGILQLHISS